MAWTARSPSLVRCSFKLPLAYNDGQTVEEARREELLDLVFVEFGGWTEEGVERGAYRQQGTGKKHVEYLMKIGVAVADAAAVDRLRDLVARIGGELGQECMYFEVSTGTSVELVPSAKKGGR